MGTGVVCQLVSQLAKPPAAVILLAPYYSISDVVKEHSGKCGSFISKLVKDHFDTGSNIHKIKAPLLIIHGEQDTYIPIE